jgi:putative glutathione S-transferase
MGRLIDGDWYTEDEVAELRDDSGEFQREETTFREWVSEPRSGSDSRAAQPRDEADPDAEFPAEPGRYHLYVSYACPWAHRTLLTRALKGLEEVISVDVVDPVRVDQGWEFAPEKPGCTPDTVHGSDYLREVYRAADPEYTGRVSVPVLWDREQGTIVNNESEEIAKMLDAAFDEYAERDVTLYPGDLRDDIDEVVADVYETINNGVYKAGFARTQAAYDDAVSTLFDALDRYDDRLADRRFLVGDRLTLADVFLFPTLYRFDEIYHTHFRCNRRRVADYDSLWPYLRDLYRLPGVAGTCNMDHAKTHYYVSHTSLNPKQIIPTGPDPDFDAPHDRDRLPGEPPEDLTTAEPLETG